LEKDLPCSALITGANSPLGIAIALRLLSQNFRVAGLGRQSIAKSDFQDKCRHLSEQATYFQCDLTDASSLDALLPNMAVPNVIFHVAGAYQSDVESILLVREALTLLVQLHVGSLLHLARHFAPRMKPYSSILAISSNLTRRATSESCIYAASKAALECAVRHLAIECAPNVTVNCIAPGLFRSPMTQGRLAERDFEAVRHRTPMGRLTTAEDLAEAAIRLTCPPIPTMTGECMIIDGGNTLSW
jgi:3-oxoacyl-[acyl-carrier protein] reductase